MLAQKTRFAASIFVIFDGGDVCRNLFAYAFGLASRDLASFRVGDDGFYSIKIYSEMAIRILRYTKTTYVLAEI